MVQSSIAILLRRGADPNLPNLAVETPFLALFNRRARAVSAIAAVVPILLDHGADPTLPDTVGNYPIYKAAEILSAEKFKPVVYAATRKLGLRNTDELDTWLKGWKDIFELEDSSEVLRTLNYLCETWDGGKGLRLKMQSTAVAVLAEMHMERTGDLFSNEEQVHEKRNRMAAIIRDCRAQNVQIDWKYIDDLLELCR